MCKRVCLTCGNENEKRIIPTRHGFEICTCCGGSLFDLQEVAEEIPDAITIDIPSNAELLAFKLQQQYSNIIF